MGKIDETHANASPKPTLLEVKDWLASVIPPVPFLGARIQRYRKKISAFRRWEHVYSSELNYLRGYCASLERDGRENGNAPPRASWRFVAGRRVLNEISADYAHFYLKLAKTRNKWSGLSADQAFFLEVECLERLRECSQPGKTHPFPIVATSDPDTLEIKMTHCGLTLTDLAKMGRRVKVFEWEAQIDGIIACLDEAGVMHLDIHPNGQNLCVDDQGNLSLIDFDIAMLTGSDALSFQIHERYMRALCQAGTYSEFARQSLRKAVQNNFKVLTLI